MTNSQPLDSLAGFYSPAMLAAVLPVYRAHLNARFESERCARHDQLSGVAAGLVSVSTTCKTTENANFRELLESSEEIEGD